MGSRSQGPGQRALAVLDEVVRVRLEAAAFVRRSAAVPPSSARIALRSAGRLRPAVELRIHHPAIEVHGQLNGLLPVPHRGLRSSSSGRPSVQRQVVAISTPAASKARLNLVTTSRLARGRRKRREIPAATARCTGSRSATRPGSSSSAVVRNMYGSSASFTVFPSCNMACLVSCRVSDTAVAANPIPPDRPRAPSRWKRPAASFGDGFAYGPTCQRVPADRLRMRAVAEVERPRVHHPWRGLPAWSTAHFVIEHEWTAWGLPSPSSRRRCPGRGVRWPGVWLWPRRCRRACRAAPG